MGAGAMPEARLQRTREAYRQIVVRPTLTVNVLPPRVQDAIDAIVKSFVNAKGQQSHANQAQ